MSRPSHHPSSKHYKYAGKLDHAIKTTTYTSYDSKIVSQKIYETLCDGKDENFGKEKEKDRNDGNRKSQRDYLDDEKKIITLESNNCIHQAASEVVKCDSNGVNGSLTSHVNSKLGINYCSSSQKSFYAAAHYMEAKQSFTNTELSECMSSLGKSGESGEVISSEFIEGSKTHSLNSQNTSNGISGDSGSSSFHSTTNKPHKTNDTKWEAIQAVRFQNNGGLELKNFRLFKRLGAGDIGSVHLAELIGTRTCFAIKVMDKEALVSRKKLLRAQTEREILQSLDHPFLPTLYAHFETEKLSFLVMEFCPGGDMHLLRQKQPGKFFPEHASRFYLAEVLLALEYLLHMLGIIYRDLKPENVLVREDGHIMLSDFDLSLRCNPQMATT